MSSLFENTCNTRLLFKNDTRFIRSDVPIKLTEDEIQWLIHHNVRTIFDLRSENERFKQPSLFENDTRFIYHHTPVTGGQHIPRTPEEVSLSYIHMVDENMWKIIYMMLHASTHVLYFCNAGKDRTGIVSYIHASVIQFEVHYHSCQYAYTAHTTLHHRLKIPPLKNLVSFFCVAVWMAQSKSSFLTKSGNRIKEINCKSSFL